MGNKTRIQKQKNDGRFLKLGDAVLAWSVLPYPVSGKRQRFYVDWPSYWEDGLNIEIGVVAVRKRSGRWKVVELELPEDVSAEDAEDIVLCHWYVFDKSDRRRKSPPVLFAWELRNIRIAACERPTQDRQVVFAEQFRGVEKDEVESDRALVK